MLFNLINKNYARILLLFTMSPGRNRTRSEIKQGTELNNVPLDIALNKLINLGILSEKKKIYSLNLENELVARLLEEKKIFINLPIKVQFVLIEFIDNITRLRDIRDIILFGSYAKLIFTDRSDIDIALILDNRIKDKAKLEKKIFLIKNKISKEYKKEIHTSYFLEQDLKHKEDPLIKDIVQNGKSLI